MLFISLTRFSVPAVVALLVCLGLAARTRIFEREVNDAVRLIIEKARPIEEDGTIVTLENGGGVSVSEGQMTEQQNSSDVDQEDQDDEVTEMEEHGYEQEDAREEGYEGDDDRYHSTDNEVDSDEEDSHLTTIRKRKHPRKYESFSDQ